MKVFVNDKEQEVNGENSLEHLITKTIQDTNGIAIAVNSVVVPKKDWNMYRLNNNDKILIIKATQGG